MKIVRVLGCIGVLASVPLSLGAAQAQDAEQGRRVFNQCRACHTVDPERSRPTGPSLYGIVGRTPAAWEGYKYSPGMTEFGSDGKVWTEELISDYLANPRTVVPGTRMAFPGLRRPEDRANLIAYLKSVMESE